MLCCMLYYLYLPLYLSLNSSYFFLDEGKRPTCKLVSLASLESQASHLTLARGVAEI